MIPLTFTRRSIVHRVVSLLIWLILLASGHSLRLDAKQRSWLREKQTLVIGMPAVDWTPYSYYTGSNRYQGLLHDYLQTVSQRLDLRLDYKTYPTFEDAQQALRSGEVDALAGVASPPGCISPRPFPAHQATQPRLPSPALHSSLPLQNGKPE